MNTKTMKLLVVLVWLAVAVVAVFFGRVEWVKYQARELVRAELNDPDSAKFRGLSVHATAVCGQVNARNRMGGYVGYRDFVAHRLVDYVEIHPGAEPGVERTYFDAMRAESCI